MTRNKFPAPRERRHQPVPARWCSGRAVINDKFSQNKRHSNPDKKDLRQPTSASPRPRQRSRKWPKRGTYQTRDASEKKGGTDTEKSEKRLMIYAVGFDFVAQVDVLNYLLASSPLSPFVICPWPSSWPRTGVPVTKAAPQTKIMRGCCGRLAGKMSWEANVNGELVVCPGCRAGSGKGDTNSAQ